MQIGRLSVTHGNIAGSDDTRTMSYTRTRVFKLNMNAIMKNHINIEIQDEGSINVSFV